jgi:GT2 family glycosyltransferase
VPEIGAVVIGRNEGARLELSLASVQEVAVPLVYADSGSIDGSPETAERLGVPVVRLDPALPFSAGRGRNEGLAELLRRWPSTDFVIFLDGDCTLDPKFPAAAVKKLTFEPNCAIVTGILSERFPERSVYNRLCAIEWRSPAGKIENMNRLGGIMAVRVSAFQQVGGFNLQAIAGEEPDLGVRLSLAGWSILKIDQPMATHDAEMLRFGQWWRRMLRGGHAMAHRYASHGHTVLRDGRREVRSVLFWGFLLPLAVLLLLIPTRGASLLLLGGYLLLGWRVYRHYRSAELSRSDALLASRFIIIGKVPEFLGIVRYVLNRSRGQFEVIDWR